MIITRATVQDIKQAATLFDSYRQFYKQAPDLDGAETYITDRLQKGDSAIFLAKAENEYVGFMQLYPTFSSISMKHAWILNDLYVSESARQQGVGEALLEMAETFARESGACSIALSVQHQTITKHSVCTNEKGMSGISSFIIMS
ncbi:GNAT family N-acetyltransferase [Terribacillus saccharophilus]|uniref:GNAT family N-acetyltransferase n=1 Tax=Terribacillus saccharophilus TaxID=361277 RepID=UPI003982D641